MGLVAVAPHLTLGCANTLAWPRGQASHRTGDSSSVPKAPPCRSPRRGTGLTEHMHGGPTAIPGPGRQDQPMLLHLSPAHCPRLPATGAHDTGSLVVVFPAAKSGSPTTENTRDPSSHEPERGKKL